MSGANRSREKHSADSYNFGSPRTSVENNLEDLPWAVVSSTNQGRKGIIRYSWSEEWSDSDGKSRSSDHHWEVREARGLGLPGRIEQDVYVALLELLEKRGGMPEDRVLYFSLHELMKILGWYVGGDKSKRLKQALRRISSTTIYSDKAFYNPRLKQFISDTFQPFSAHFSDVRNDEGYQLKDRNHVIWHPYFADSYRESYEGKLDTAYYWSLEGHLARRLYRLLDRRAVEKAGGKARTWETDLFEIRDLVPLAEYTRPAKIRQVLDRDAHEELRAKGFISSVTYRELRDGRTKRVLVRYRLSSSFRDRSFARRPDLTDAERDGVRQLCSIGVNVRVAERLVAEHGAERCLYWLELIHVQDGIDWSMAPGLLVNAIRDEPERWEEVARRKGYSGLGSRNSKRRSNDDSVEPADPGRDENTGCEAGSDHPNPGEASKSDPEALEVWEKVLEDVAGEINAPSLRVWFEGTVPIALSPTSLTISVPNGFAKSYIESRFLEMLENALAKRLSPTSSLEIVVGTKSATDNTNKGTG